MKLNENKLNTAHAIIYAFLGFFYPVLFFIILLNEKKIFVKQSELIIPFSFSCVVLANLLIMLCAKINLEFERNLKIMDYFTFSGTRKLGQRVDWKSAILKYENKEMDRFFRIFFNVKIYSCLGLWLIFLLF